MKGFIVLFTLLTLALNCHAQLNIELGSQLTYTQQLNDVWGYVDDSGNEYALVGLTDGVSIVNVSDPTEPIKLFTIPGPTSTWRDLKVWNHRLYVVNETSGGLKIINLENLPQSVEVSVWQNNALNTAHNIFIDDNGLAYLFGSNLANGGAYILDLNDNPDDPTYVGAYSGAYVHDGFVRNDTLWAAEVFNGQFSVVDMTDLSNPQLINNQSTLSNFTHNCWLSDDGHYLFTTDEVAGAWVTAYDVSNPQAIYQTSQYRHTSNGENVIPHNVLYKDGFTITSYYTSGVSIADVNWEGRFFVTGTYDTSPSSGGTFNGCWGVYPYLPSGHILATDREEGLFVLMPDYVRPSYLEATVTDVNGTAIDAALVDVLGVEKEQQATNFLGKAYLGVQGEGNFYAVVSADGYPNDTILIEQMTSGVVTELMVTLGGINDTIVVDTLNIDSMMMVNCVNPVNFEMKLWLEGAYQSTTGKMKTTLLDNELLPLSHPFNTDVYNYEGDEAVESLEMMPTDAVDWILVGLLNGDSLVERKAALVNTDGYIVSTNGNLGVEFCNVLPNIEYNLLIQHKNHLNIISSFSVYVGNESYDFTTGLSQAMGAEQLKALNDTTFAMYAGDYDGNNVINNLDFNIWREDNAMVNEYMYQDGDLNGVSNNLDYNLWKVNRSKVGVLLNP